MAEPSRRSHNTREADRRQWRDRILPHWRMLKAEYLTDHEATVLSLRLGISNNAAVTTATVARRLNVSAETVTRIERSALAKCGRILTLEGLES